MTVSQELNKNNEYINWQTVFYDSEKSKDDSSNVSWTTYFNNINKGKASYPIDIRYDGELKFMYKCNEKIGVNRHIKIYKNNMFFYEMIPKSQKNWNYYSTELSSSDNLSIEFDFGIGGSTVWIAFPPRPTSEYIAQPQISLATPACSTDKTMPHIQPPIIPEYAKKRTLCFPRRGERN